MVVLPRFRGRRVSYNFTCLRSEELTKTVKKVRPEFTRTNKVEDQEVRFECTIHERSPIE